MSAHAKVSDTAMKHVVEVEGTITWKWGRTAQGQFIAICDPFGQTIQAAKFSDLLASINEALDSTFRELFSSGDLERFLRDRGWSAKLPTKPQKNIRFDMPFDLKGVKKRDLQEAVC